MAKYQTTTSVTYDVEQIIEADSYNEACRKAETTATIALVAGQGPFVDCYAAVPA